MQLHFQKFNKQHLSVLVIRIHIPTNIPWPQFIGIPDKLSCDMQILVVLGIEENCV
jgi:hypothetical protein